MQLTINNFRGIKHLSVALHPQITLIAAQNGGGKTSLAQVLGAMISGTEIPIAGIAKKHAKMFLHNGAAGGDAVLDTSKGTLSTSWPECKITGQGPRASAYAAGIKEPLLTPQELQSYIKCTPTKDELAHEFVGVEGVPVDAVWNTIEKQGWDAALERAKARGAELKGQWRQITGEAYGSTKAENWSPKGYWGHSVEELAEQMKTAREAYETALKQSAVDEHRLKELEAKAETPLDVFEGRLLTSKESVALAESNWKSAVEETKKLFAVTETAALECPWCAEPVVVVGSQVVKPTAKKPTKKQQQSAVERYNEAQKMEAEMLARYQQAVAEQAIAERDVADVKEAKEVIAMKRDQEQIPMDQALALMTQVSDQLDAAKAKHQADDIANQIFVNKVMQDVLCPDGLRRQKLQQSVGEFNELVRAVADTAQWGVIELDDIDLTPTMNGKPYKLLSASEQFRVVVTLQVVLAKLDGSDMVVIDAADILDRDGRNGLVTLLKQIEIPSVVTMTFNSQGDAPDLGAAGFGLTHWICAKEAVAV